MESKDIWRVVCTYQSHQYTPRTCQTHCMLYVHAICMWSSSWIKDSDIHVTTKTVVWHMCLVSSSWCDYFERTWKYYTYCQPLLQATGMYNIQLHAREVMLSLFHFRVSGWHPSSGLIFMAFPHVPQKFPQFILFLSTQAHLLSKSHVHLQHNAVMCWYSASDFIVMQVVQLLWVSKRLRLWLGVWPSCPV
jgi:hypothetical protein